MASVNKVILIGNLGKDPEVRSFPNGDRVANITVATTERWKDKKSNEMKEATEWHRVSFFGRLAEIVEQYLRKGSQVYVEGSLRTREWTDKEGVKRYSTDIRADEMKMLGSRAGMGAPSSDEAGGYDNAPQRSAPAARPPAMAPRAPAPSAAKSPSGFDDMDDDIPF